MGARPNHPLQRIMTVRPPILLSLAAMVTLCQSAPLDFASLPDLQAGSYKVAPYIKAAAALQGLGREVACEALLRAAPTNRESRQIVVLCRMLFTKRATADFRGARIGGAHFLGGTDYADWPLEPIELVDGVPFLITDGYRLDGRAEAAENYVRYCMANCDWSTFRFSDVSAAMPVVALKNFYASPKWRRPLDNDERDFLSAQIE